MKIEVWFFTCMIMKRRYFEEVISHALWYELCELLIGISDLIGDESDSVKRKNSFVRAAENL